MARLLDLFAVLLAPLAAALAQEFGPPPAATPAPVVAVAPPPVDPLYTRRGSGKGTRYDLATADAAGPKFKKVKLANGRTKYLPA